MTSKTKLEELLEEKRSLSHELNSLCTNMVGEIKDQCLDSKKDSFENIVQNKCLIEEEKRSCRHNVSIELQNNISVKECKDKIIEKYKKRLDCHNQKIIDINKMFVENIKSLEGFQIEYDEKMLKAKSELGCSKESMNDFRKTNQFSKLENCQIEVLKLELTYIDDYFQIYPSALESEFNHGFNNFVE